MPLAAAVKAPSNKTPSGKAPSGIDPSGMDKTPATETRPAAAGRVTELRVSANLMTLDTGVYCIFPAPGSPAPDAMTGLPGLRITPCPGRAGRPEAVSISTFREDGWLENTAALVRVSEGPAQVLVTIYQDAGQSGETAPRLQVLRLSGDPAAPLTEEAARSAPSEARSEIMAHVQGAGDVTGAFGTWIGKPGSQMWIEGFGISDTAPLPAGELEYQGVLGKGWLSPWVENGKFCGSRGMALPLLGLNMRLKGAAARDYTLRYSATFVDGGKAGPVEAGTTCESPELAALEAFMIELTPKVARPAPSRAPVSGKAPPPGQAQAPMKDSAPAKDSPPMKAPARTPARPGRR